MQLAKITIHPKLLQIMHMSQPLFLRHKQLEEVCPVCKTGYFLQKWCRPMIGYRINDVIPHKLANMDGQYRVGVALSYKFSFSHE
jgi:hypothetical protein